MPASHSIPDDRFNEPFLIRDSDVDGFSPAVFRGKRFRRSSQGVYVAMAHVDDLSVRCTALSAVVKHDLVFSHLTAARLWGMPEWRIGDSDLHITQALGNAPVRRKSVVTHRCSVPVQDVHFRGAIPVTTVCANTARRRTVAANR